MPCTNCMAEYSRTRKEHGCSKCAFSFCAKCLSKKFVIPVLSPKPVSVCNNCYDKLTNKSNENELIATSSKDRTSSKNWWGDDRLPPPSMRAQYAAEKKKSTITRQTTVANNTSAGTDWDSLEKRLEDLTRDLPSLTTRVRTASTSKDKETSKNVSLAEIEERLAVLKDVPVEMIRNPRLRIYDSNNGDRDGFADEAERLIAMAEAHAKIERRQDGYYNEGLQIDDDDIYNHLSESSNTSDNSLMLRQTINSALNAPLQSSDGEDAFQPNFAECIEQTMKDAETAKQHALKFISLSQEEERQQHAKQSQQQQIKDKNDFLSAEQRLQEPFRINDQFRSTVCDSNAASSSPSKKIMSPSRVKNFFQRFKK